MLKRGIRKGSCQVSSWSGASRNAGKNSPVDYFSDAAWRNPSGYTKKVIAKLWLLIMLKRGIRKGSCQVSSWSGASRNAGKNSPIILSFD